METFEAGITRAVVDLRDVAKQKADPNSEASRLKAALYREYVPILTRHWEGIKAQLPEAFSAENLFKHMYAPRSAGVFHQYYELSANSLALIIKTVLKSYILGIDESEFLAADELIKRGAGETTWIDSARLRIYSGLDNAFIESLNTFYGPIEKLLFNEDRLPEALLDADFLLDLLSPLQYAVHRNATVNFSQFGIISSNQILRIPVAEIVCLDGNWRLKVNDEPYEKAARCPIKAATRMCPAHQVEGAIDEVAGWVFNNVFKPMVRALVEYEKRQKRNEEEKSYGKPSFT